MLVIKPVAPPENLSPIASSEAMLVMADEAIEVIIEDAIDVIIEDAIEVIIEDAIDVIISVEAPSNMSFENSSTNSERRAATADIFTSRWDDTNASDASVAQANRKLIFAHRLYFLWITRR